MDTAHVLAGDEWALPQFRLGRALRLAAMALDLSLSGFFFSVRPAQLLEDAAFIAGVIAGVRAHISGVLKSDENAHGGAFVCKVLTR